MRERLPEWLKRGIIDTEETRFVRGILKKNGLNTVCDSARCPNRGECYASHTATFMILGNTCTRNCRFCSVNSNIPEPVNPDEPFKVADAVKKMGLHYVVITSVTRDDLKDGGAGHFEQTIQEIRKIDETIKIEILTPDFKGDKAALDTIIKAQPDVFNHNIETVKSLYSKVRPQANYQQSLDVLKYVKNNSNITTKSGLMVGLGETFDDLKMLFADLQSVGVDIVTVGQYIQPTKQHVQVERYLTPQEFEDIKKLGLTAGIENVVSAPLARSSYKAKECFCN